MKIKLPLNKGKLLARKGSIIIWRCVMRPSLQPRRRGEKICNKLGYINHLLRRKVLAILEVPCVLRNMKAHYLIHNSQSLLPISLKVNPFPTILYILEPILKLSPHRILLRQSGLFPSEFQTKTFFNYCFVRLNFSII